MVPDIFSEYFDVKLAAVSWTTTVISTVYLVAVFPAMWFLERFDLRKCHLKKFPVQEIVL